MNNETTKDFVLKTTQTDSMSKNYNGFVLQQVNLVDNVLRRDDSDCVRLGFSELDGSLGGLDGGDLVMIASDNGRLNSTFAISLIQKVCVSGGHPMLYFSPGCKSDIVFFELLVNCGMLHTSIHRGYEPGDVDNLNRALNQLGKTQIYVNDTPELLIQELSSGTVKTVTSYGVELVLINHLDFIRTDSPGGFRTDETEEVLKQLKFLARVLDIPVVLFVVVPDMGTRKPQLTDLGYAGFFERYADVILFLQDVDHIQPGQVNVSVARSRGGTNGVIPLAYIDWQYRFENLARIPSALTD